MDVCGRKFAANGNASAVLASKSGAKTSLVKGFAGYPWINRSRYGGGKQNYRCHPQMWILGFFSRREIRGEVTKKKLYFCCPRRLPTSAPNHALLTVWSPPRRFKLKQEILHQRKCHFNSQANVDNNLQTTQQSRSKPVSRCYVQNVHQSCRAMPPCW